MADLIGATIGKILTLLGYDGTVFRPVKIDEEGSLVVVPVPLGKNRTLATLWDTVVGAGATQAVLVSTNGSGYVTDVMFRVTGTTNDIKASRVDILLDAARTAQFVLNEMLYLNGGVKLGFAGIECFEWDMTTHEFWVHWRVEIPFQESIKIDVVNTDASNACTMRVLVIYRLDP